MFASFIGNCSEAGPFLYNNITTIANGRETIAGIPVNCIGHYTALCNDGALSQLGLDKLCEYFGFDKSKQASTPCIQAMEFKAMIQMSILVNEL